LRHKNVEYLVSSKFINPATWMVLFGVDVQIHSLFDDQTKREFAPNDHPLLYCIWVFAHAGSVVDPHVKSGPQYQLEVPLDFKICHAGQLNESNPYPVAHVAHVAPGFPVSHFAPVAPVAHVAPVAPVAHVAPGFPVSHFAPVAPVAHVAPGFPVSHFAPVAPVSHLSHFGHVAQSEHIIVDHNKLSTHGV
jgi:hypothetical protein